MITKEEWRNGEYRNKAEFKTQEGYYKSVGEFVKTYGEPTKEDMLVARMGGMKEFHTGKYGCSWNPSLNVTRQMAKFYAVDTIYVMFVPKGTMAVHYELGEGGIMCGLEEEYVFDMAGLGLNKRNGKIHIIAKHSGDWDYHSDFETEDDFGCWKLVPVPSINNIDENILEKFFAYE